MKKIIVIRLLIIALVVIGCKSKYYQEVPYKFLYDEVNFPETYPSDSIIKDKVPLTTREMYLKEKYSIILNIEPSELTNYKFYDYVDQFLRHNYDKAGFANDTIANMGPFVSSLYKYAFKKSLPKTPVDIFKSNEINKFTGRDYLQEGDIVFFRYHKDSPISDVGVYLRNNRILISSRRSGLIISDFSQEYFQLRYVCAGRLKSDDEQ